MSPTSCSGPTDLLLPATLEADVVEQAQACLRCRERGEVPTAAQSQAWDRFYAMYDPLLRRFVATCGIVGADADDCRQEAWLEIIRHLPLFHSDATQRAMCSWLRSIVHGKAVDLLRYQARRPAKRLQLAAEQFLAGLDVDPIADLERHGRQEAVQRVLAALRHRVSELTFRAFSRYWMEGLTLRQLAEELHETPRQVSCRIYKAKEKFRELCNRLIPDDLLIDR